MKRVGMICLFVAASLQLARGHLRLTMRSEGEVAGRLMSDSPSDYHSSEMVFWTRAAVVLHSPLAVPAFLLGSPVSQGGWFLTGVLLANSILWGLVLPWAVCWWRRRRAKRPRPSHWSILWLAGGLILLPAIGFVVDLFVPPSDTGIVPALFHWVYLTGM